MCYFLMLYMQVVYITEKVHNRACVGKIKAFDKVIIFVLVMYCQFLSSLDLATPKRTPPACLESFPKVVTSLPKKMKHTESVKKSMFCVSLSFPPHIV